MSQVSIVDRSFAFQLSLVGVPVCVIRDDSNVFGWMITMATVLLLFGYIAICTFTTLLYLTGNLHRLGVISLLEQVR